MKKYIFTIFILFIITVPPVLAGGGWTKKKGSGYYKLTQWWLISDKHFVRPGAKAANQTTGLFNTFVYAEHGITDRLTGLLYLPFLSSSVRYDQISATNKMLLDTGDVFTTVGDIDISLKYGISKPGSAFVFAATILFGIPTGNISDDGRLQTGDKEFNQMLRLDLSRSFSLANKMTLYGSVYSSLNNRTNNYSDEYRYGVEAGMSFLKNRLWLISRLDAIESFKNSSLSSQDDTSTIFANNTELLSFGGEIAFKFNEKIGISYSLTNTISGSIVLAGTAHSIGIFLDL